MKRCIRDQTSGTGLERTVKRHDEQDMKLGSGNNISNKLKHANGMGDEIYDDEDHKGNRKKQKGKRERTAKYRPLLWHDLPLVSKRPHICR